ncbi:lachesin-like [Cylas formicarius]|uniref:lachesin-like n=1 Tax=Cylas formicarius TaxID=197179 RepID=UPI002958B0CA|nr:lachesin-like [Cylas formicarius]
MKVTLLLFCTLLPVNFTKGQLAEEPEPEFLAPLENHTVPQGRDIFFTCVVNHLSSYKVAWIKSDNKAILAIHTHMVAQNPRLSVTHNGHNTWKLHVQKVQREDSGTYMCQINTDPMRSQMGILEVVIPPDILPDNESSESSGVVEGGTIRLRCRATGVPLPTVNWKREDGKNIIIRHELGREKSVSSFDGEILTLTNVQRTDMGVYLCIAKNGVPPLVSKRFDVVVHFHPLIIVTNQLLASPIARDVVMQCGVQASPKAMNHWMRDTGEKIIPSEKHEMEEKIVNEYSLEMNLKIRNIERKDIGGYICTSSNALGKAEGTVRLQEIHLPLETTSTTTTPKYVAPKTHKPLAKEKPAKTKTGKTRKKEFESKREEISPFVLFVDNKLLTPSVTVATTTSQSPVILQQTNISSSKVSTSVYLYFLLFYHFIFTQKSY